MLYPPFADICMAGFVSDSHPAVIRSASRFMESFIEEAKSGYSDIPLRLLGPSPASVAKISNKYRYKIIIKCRNDRRFRKLLSDTVIKFNSNKENKNVSVYIDMNVLSF
jgi:primosomal protein N' (replication factor Y)